MTLITVLPVPASLYAAISWIRGVEPEETEELFPYGQPMHDTDEYTCEPFRKDISE